MERAARSGSCRALGEKQVHKADHDLAGVLVQACHKLIVGYRLIVQREGKRVRLFTRNGNDWTARYPLIVEAAVSHLRPMRH